MAKIQAAHPTLTYQATLIEKLPLLKPAVMARTSDQRNLGFIALSALAQTLRTTSWNTLGKHALSAARANALTGALAEGWYHSMGDKMDEASAAFKKAFELETQFTDALERYRSPSILLYGRSAFHLEKFSEAEIIYQKVPKRSNDLIAGLNERAWSYLKSEKYPEAVGTILSLQSGVLKRAFSPESYMMMGMALNELCQYPEAVKATLNFKKAYGPDYAWLVRWRSNPTAIYPEAVKVVRKQSQVSAHISSEWLKSPLFLGGQEEINLIQTQPEKVKTVIKLATLERKNRLEKISKNLNALESKILDMKKATPAVREEFLVLKRDWKRYRNLVASGASFAKIWQFEKSRENRRQKILVQAIENELKAVTVAMFKKLDEVAVQVRLVDAEIYSDASHDVIFQNAYPDFAKKIQNYLAQTAEKSSKERADRVWNWGKVPGAVEGKEEVWEDEVGAFQAELVDRCEGKKNFIASQRKQRSKLRSGEAREPSATVKNEGSL